MARRALHNLTAVAFLCAMAFTLAGCGHQGVSATPGTGTRIRIAVLPVENMSAVALSSREIQQSIKEKLRKIGVDVVAEDAIEGAMAKHRVRYVGGVSGDLAKAFRSDTGADALLVTGIELYDEEQPLKIAIQSRLVTTGDTPVISWMESVSLGGDDAPGLLGLGRVQDMGILRERALATLAASLERHLSGYVPERPEAEGKYRPKRTYNAFAFDAGIRPTIAVLPFLNESGRRYAGEYAALHFVRELSKSDFLRPIEPGIVRDKMLAMRIIMNDGVSLAAADIMANTLDTDYILTGRVFEYRDSRGAQRKTRVEFSIQVIERVSKKIVWSSRSSSAGDDGIQFFDLGRLSTAHAVAARLSRSVVAKMAEKS